MYPKIREKIYSSIMHKIEMSKVFTLQQILSLGGVYHTKNNLFQFSQNKKHKASIFSKLKDVNIIFVASMENKEENIRLFCEALYNTWERSNEKERKELLQKVEYNIFYLHEVKADCFLIAEK